LGKEEIKVYLLKAQLITQSFIQFQFELLNEKNNLLDKFMRKRIIQIPRFMGSIKEKPLLSKKLKRTETRLLIIDDNQLRYNQILNYYSKNIKLMAIT
jgi:hypothetical protein